MTTTTDLLALLREVQTELRHCRVFVSTREKIAPVGLALYDQLAGRVDAALFDTGRYVQGGASKPLAEVLSIKLGDRAGTELPITLSRREWDLIVAALNAPTVPDRDSVELAKEMWLTLDGNRGYNLTITAARTKRIAEEFLKLAAPDWLSRISLGE